jgi:NAD(P)-dependent dehydrogenase (short-subunit alcohol dehydrogenase family)
MSSQSIGAPLDGRHAVITGASRGIGRAIAIELNRLGANTTLIARDLASLQETARLLPNQNDARFVVASASVVDPEALRAAIESGRNAFGPVDILINNAGGTQSSPFLKETLASWRQTIDLNLTAAFTATQACLPDMIAKGFGRIVNVASTASLKGVAYAAAYTAAKHGLLGLTRALALENAKKGVTVNAVCPGYTETPMLVQSVEKMVEKTHKTADDIRGSLASLNPMGRFVTSEEVARAVGWLCDPSSAAINGIAMPVAGGEIG